MGVPAFYRWLSEKYPKIVTDVLEERVHLIHNSGSIREPFDCTRPNPSGLECDNFYIDMNGIIHPCSHPENGPQPQTEEEMYENVCRYVDRLFRAVRPRKLLYLAIDGVAPRAKMNQQRSRRFRAAQEAREKKELEEELKKGLMKAGHQFQSSGGDEAWDSNVITPGTKFMLNLSEYLRFYIRKRISTDKAWKNITVIFSDASIPGEGEHKIMAHVRHQRSQPNYNPNLVHVLHGLDADLIMLALATHEAHFYILREEVLFGRKGMELSEKRKNESGFADAQKQLDEAVGAEAMQLPENKVKPLQRISIPILREYLAFEFQECNNVPFRQVSFERLVDDIVFLCFFVGNDFLPHLPSLDIRDGALDFLFNVYKRVLPTLGDYITNHGGEVNLSHVDVILAEVGAIEDYVFQMKHHNEEGEKRRKEQTQERKKYLTRNGQAPLANPPGGTIVDDVPKVKGRAARVLDSSTDMTALGKHGKADVSNHNSLEENAMVAEQLKASLRKEEKAAENISTKRKAEDISKEDSSDVKSCEEEINDVEEVEDSVLETETSLDYEEEEDIEEEIDQAKLDEATALLKKKLKEVEQQKLNDYAAKVEDKVRLHEKGWKQRYYTDKCKADDVAENGGKEHLFRSYVMGLCWVMKYYYEGCPSWKWFYPFHYAPFASDLKNIERFRRDCSNFEMGEPFKPIEQLMAVFPQDSSHAIPKASRWLMSDPESPIIDFYPKEIACDPNGKAMPWLWVVLLPFIDEDRLLAALKPTEKDWSEYDRLCNSRGLDDGYIYCHISHSLASALTPVIDTLEPHSKMHIDGCDIFGALRQPLSNELYPLDKRSVIQPPKTSYKIKSENVDELLTSPVDPNAALCAAFTEPPKGVHMSIILRGAQPPKPVLRSDDLHIRRPRLNRGGGTIANLGAGRSSGQSHQAGYGSMNISSYERSLAERSGRGHQMNQAGTRAWGAMEPTAKRPRGVSNHHSYSQSTSQYQPTLFQQPFQHGNHRGGHAQSSYPNTGTFQQRGSTNTGNRGLASRWQPPGQQQQQQQQQPPPHFSPQPMWAPALHRQPVPSHPPPPPHQQQQQSSRNGYNFQQFSTTRNHTSHHHHQQQQHQGQHQRPGQGSSRSGVSTNVMNNLRSQLKSTLHRNKKTQN